MFPPMPVCNGADMPTNLFLHDLDPFQRCANFQKTVVCGDADDDTLKVIESEGIELLIMGTHGRKGLEQVIFGIVAEKVVKKSPVPVLMINPYKLR